jgi:hypothetical protein
MRIQAQNELIHKKPDMTAKFIINIEKPIKNIHGTLNNTFKCHNCPLRGKF